MVSGFSTEKEEEAGERRMVCDGKRKQRSQVKGEEIAALRWRPKLNAPHRRSDSTAGKYDRVKAYSHAAVSGRPEHVLEGFKD